MYKCKNCGYDGCNDTYTEQDVNEVIARLGNYVKNHDPNILPDRKFEYTRYDESETKFVYNEDLQEEVKRRLEARGLEIKYERFKKGEYFGGNRCTRDSMTVHIRIPSQFTSRYSTEAYYKNQMANEWNRVKRGITDDLEKIRTWYSMHKEMFDYWYDPSTQKLYQARYPKQGLRDTSQMAKEDAIAFFMNKNGYW